MIKERSGIPSETTRTRENFRDRFLERDGFCVFTGATPTESAGVHIIPHRRGSEVWQGISCFQIFERLYTSWSQWFRGIIHNRPNYEENVEDLTEINDIRNGLCMYASAHSLFDQREAVILKVRHVCHRLDNTSHPFHVGGQTPNRWLNMKDVPPRADRPLELDASVTYPKDARYTLHWLEPRNTYRLSRLVAPNNIDAAFRKRTRKPKPSALLLHYNYGVAAAKRWGHGAELFETHDNPARPKVLESASMGPSKTSHDRSIAIQKLESVQNTNEAGTTDAADGDQPGESTERTRWDTDDLVLFFWGNSPAAMERHRKKQEEKLQDLERWRQGLQLA